MQKITAYFAYLFVGTVFLLVSACESDNEDNPLNEQQMSGYFNDTIYWNTFGPEVYTIGRDSLDRDTLMFISGTSDLGNGNISMFIPFPGEGTFTFSNPDSIPDSLVNLSPTLSYRGVPITNGELNITRYDTVRFVLEGNFTFSFDEVVTFETDSSSIDSLVETQFTQGHIISHLVRR